MLKNLVRLSAASQFFSLQASKALPHMAEFQLVARDLKRVFLPVWGSSFHFFLGAVDMFEDSFRLPASSGSYSRVGLMENLSPRDQLTLRKFVHVTKSPPDSPRFGDLIAASVSCINEFGKSLSNPNDAFKNLLGDLEGLECNAKAVIMAHPQKKELSQSMKRRKSKHPAWSLLTAICNDPPAVQIQLTVGAAISLCLASDKVLSKKLASDLRKNHEHACANEGEFKWKSMELQQSAEKIRREAVSAFETVPPIFPEPTFTEKVLHHFFRQQKYSSPRHRHGTFDRTTQSKLEVIKSGGNLMARITSGDEDATIIALAFCSGLPADLVTDLLLVDYADDDWAMVVDLEQGVIKTNIDPIFPESASPSDQMLDAYRPACKVILKPLPALLHQALLKARNLRPSARTIRSLLPNSEVSGKTPTSDFSMATLNPSTARFLNSGAAFAIQHCGIDRLSASFILNDFSIIPGAKPYYCLVSREEIWRASSELYQALQWGDPVAFIDGPPVGSRIVPHRCAVSNLFAGLAARVRNYHPGRRYTLHSLIYYHNAFCFYCASLLAFTLAARQAKKFHFTARSFDPFAMYGAYSDKKTGQFPRALPAPLNQIIVRQLQFWRSHLGALDSRLSALGFRKSSHLRIYISKILHKQPVALFFQIKGMRPVTVGSSDLQEYWPEHLQFAGNFGRDFWQVELRTTGISSTDIDMLVRHQVLGVEPYTSTSSRVLADWCNTINKAQESLLVSMGIGAVPGLSMREDI